MKDLPKADERKIVTALQQAVKYANAGSTPDDAIVKAAGEAELPMQAVQRICEAFNTSKTLAHFKKTAGSDRADSFPIADTTKVLTALWPPVPETPVKAAAAGLHPDYARFEEREEFMKVAIHEAVKLPPLIDKVPEPYEPDPGVMAKRAIDERNHLLTLQKEARATYRDMFGRMMAAVDKAADHWRQATTPPEDFALVEKRAYAVFGEASRPLIAWLIKAGNLADRRVAVKRAAADDLGEQQMAWPEGEPYDAIADAVFFAKQAYRIAKESAIITDSVTEHAIGHIDHLPPIFVEQAIEHWLPKEAKKDMPGFTAQDRPKKVKDVYRALKREHPDMPAEMKARIAARQGKKGKQKQGPPYKAPITPWKEKKSAEAPLNALFS